MGEELKPVSRFLLTAVFENHGVMVQDVLATDAEWALMLVPYNGTGVCSVSLIRTHKNICLADFGCRTNAQEYLDENPKRLL